MLSVHTNTSQTASTTHSQTLIIYPKAQKPPIFTPIPSQEPIIIPVKTESTGKYLPPQKHPLNPPSMSQQAPPKTQPHPTHTQTKNATSAATYLPTQQSTTSVTTTLHMLHRTVSTHPTHQLGGTATTTTIYLPSQKPPCNLPSVTHPYPRHT